MNIETKLSFVSRDGRVIDSLILYSLKEGRYYCFVSTVCELLGDNQPDSIPMLLKTPAVRDYRMRVQLGPSKWRNSELFSFDQLGYAWDEHFVDGVRDEGFPPLDDSIDDGYSESNDQYAVNSDEKLIFSQLESMLHSRFSWPSTLCKYCMRDNDKDLLKEHPNGLLGHSDEGFEVCLWKWCLIPTLARSSLLEENHSQASKWL